GCLDDISLSMTANHTWTGDVIVELYAPDGTMLTIFFRTGGTTATSCGDSSELDGSYNFTDSASTNWWAAAATAGFGAVIPSGDYRTTAPAPQPSAGTSPVTSMVDAFSGVADLNGTWVLRMYDHGGGDTGSVTAATLSIEAVDGGGGCAISTFPFTETFEDDSASRGCWINEYVSGTVDWVYRTGGVNSPIVTTAHGGTLNACFNANVTAAHVTKLVSPAMDLTSLSNPELTFWYANQEWLGDQNELRIYYKTSAAGAWTLIPGAEYLENIT